MRFHGRSGKVAFYSRGKTTIEHEGAHMVQKTFYRWVYCSICVLMLSLTFGWAMQLGPFDPGVRGGVAGAGAPISGLTVKEGKYFDAGLDAFSEIQSVTGAIPNTEAGLGPRFNLDSCVGCHAQPSAGGTSPSLNPQVAVANKQG